MHLHVVIAFALLIWWSRETPAAPYITSTVGVWLTIFVQLGVIWIAAWAACRSALRTMDAGPNGPVDAQHAHHRNLFLLRGLVLISFAVDLTLTNWPDRVRSIAVFEKVPALDELIIISPFVMGTLLVLLALYPIDRAIRGCVADALVLHAKTPHTVWGRRAYLSFNIRHQLLAVMAPMTCILVVYDLINVFESTIARVLPVPWLPETVLGISAAGVFVMAPVMLKAIWTTRPLPDGILRRRLETVCDRIGLRCRDILVWKSGSMMVNAAVMGLFPRVRYVLLSDGLLESMDAGQIEAVFGHEAGHVRHRHIQYFLLFAMAAMLVASGAMELVYRWSIAGPDAPRLSMPAIQAVGFAFILILWGGGFGFVSRRFERQADVFGARCVTPADANGCRLPCGVHLDAERGPRTDKPALCATGARVFASALDRVAVLNGIPVEEPSWRHSSIASRMAFLHALSGDPNLVARFERVIRRIKAVLLAICVVGSAISVYYVWPYITAVWQRGV